MFVEDVKRLTKQNTYFRRVLHTGNHSQIVAMSISVGNDIGDEIHPTTDQILYIIDGEGEVVINGERRRIEEHDIIFVPAGASHNIINVDDEDLKLFTVYAPPEHPDGTIHKTKEEAMMVERS